MQVLIPCLIFLAVENVQLVQSEHLEGDDQEVLDSNQFKNAVAKELLKKKLSTLESSRQQDSLATFLRKGGKKLPGIRTAPKSSFHKDDDPSRKQAQMANTFIASSNLLFGTKSQQRKACNIGGKQTNKEVLDMRSLRQTYSGYNEDGGDFSASKEAPKMSLDTLHDSISAALKKRSYPKKAIQDPISCYLTEPKKVTCMHKDIIYKIALPSSEVADDEIGRIVESIYRAVEGKSSGKASLEESIEGAASQKTSLEDSAEATGSKKTSSEDSLKKKRASDDYLRSLFLNNLLVANHKTLPNYNGNNPVFIPLLIPMTQPKLDPPKAQTGYYSGMAIDPRLQIPMNLSGGVDPVNNYQTGRNLMFENGYGQYFVPDGFALPELNLKQRSQVNLTAEEEKRRNWLALMATNGLVPVENGVNPKVLTQHSANGEVQSIAEEKESLSSGNKLTVAETGEVLDKLLNKRQQRDTYFLRRQLRKKPIMEEKSTLTSFNGDGRKHMLTKVVQKLSDPGGYLWEEKKGCPCPCPCPSDLCASSKSPRKPTKCAPKYPVKLNFQLTTAQLSNGVQCCSSTTRCATTKKCSSVVTCPDGCQPIPSSRCETSSCNPCSTKSDTCGDSDILSRVVSGSLRSSEEPQLNAQNSLPLPVQASHQNWLPYSPQLIPQYQPKHAGPTLQSGQPQFVSQKDQDNQQSYFASGNRGIPLQYPALASRKPSQYSEQSKDDHKMAKANEEFDYSGMVKQQGQYSGPFQQEEEPQFSAQTNLVRNQIQVNYKQLPLGQRTNIYGSAQAAEGTAHDTGFKMNESQNKSISQAEHNNAASRQNDAKTKKHRDSFFARLRSKFHKGVPPNGTDQENQYSHQYQHIQNKALLGASIFKFNPRNQTLSGKNSSSTTSQPADNQHQCTEEPTNQSNDQTLTLMNQTQPSTVNNINITITSPGAQGQLQTNNQTNQQPQPPKNIIQCPNRIPPTARAASNSQSSRTCKVTKIWLCSQQSSINTIAPSNNTSCTQPTTCQTNQSTTCPTTPSTCQTTAATTCNTSPSTCQTTTSSMSPSTQLSTCGDSWNMSSSNDSQASDNLETTDNTPSSTCGGDTPSTPTCGSEIPLGNSQPQPENPWSPGDSQMPPGIPRPPSDTSQGSPGAKIKTFYYGPYPAWNQWQYPMDRMNPHPPEQNFNWQQQTRVPIPTPYVPQVPNQKQPEHDPRVPQPIPFTTTKVPQQKQFEHNFNPLSPLPPRRQQASWHQNLAQSQMPVPMWQQAPGRQLELDPRWKIAQPSFPNRGDSSSGLGQPIGPEFQYNQGMNSNPYEEKKWSKGNNTMVSDRTRGMSEAHLPSNIKQHIARVRRYLLKKRSKMSKQPLARSP